MAVLASSLAIRALGMECVTMTQCLRKVLYDDAAAPVSPIPVWRIPADRRRKPPHRRV